MSIANNPPVSGGELNADLPHACPATRVLVELGSKEAGLSGSEAARRLTTDGPNELKSAPSTPAWRRFLAQFYELVILLLIAAAVISLVLGEWPDALAILAIVLLNGLLGFFQEQRAEQSLAALRNLSSPVVKARRDGQLQSIAARELVQGDVIALEAGDYVPADARLLDGYSLQVQEAALTGESTPVSKSADVVVPAETQLADRHNMVHMGTVITAGRGTAIVVATAMRTHLGRIADLLQEHTQEQTPLQRRLAELGRVLIFLCLVIVGLVLILNVLRGQPLYEVFMVSVGLAVAAVPEGLPAVVTVALALGLQRMVKRNALIRKLPSVETLGCVTVICSDKTGTLTRNEMTVRQCVAGGRTYRVTGAGYAPRGEFYAENDGAVDIAADSAADLRQLLLIGAQCNNAQLVSVGADDKWQIVGDPTEGALVVAARKGGAAVEQQFGHVIYEIPFDSDRKAMSVVVRDSTGAVAMYAKGAPEVILAKCGFRRLNGTVLPLDDDGRSQVKEAAQNMATQAMRVLGLAYKSLPQDTTITAEQDESDLVLAGLIGMIDPPRDEAKKAVGSCITAGIKPIMITGDHPATALAIARELGIATASDEVATGSRLDELSDSQLAQHVEHMPVYARVTAEHKLRVVKAWQNRRQIVAMTGDGVNDAPAVKVADIGIAMGITGTDVTKEASDMVLMDDNFASILNAVEEGRGIFDNIQKFILYLLSSNASEVLLMFFAAAVGWPAPLMAIQLLWINLVTDGLPALALAMEPPERDIMQRAPRPPHEAVITRQRGVTILLHGMLMATVAALGFWMFYGGNEEHLPRARTAVFCILAFTQLFYSLSCRSQRKTMPQLGLLTNPYLFGAIAISSLAQLSIVTMPIAQPVFDSVVNFGSDWLWIIGLALVPVTVIEVTKILLALFGSAGASPHSANL